MKQKNLTSLTNFETILTKKYGEPGNPVRDLWEQGFEVFKQEALRNKRLLPSNMNRKPLRKKGLR
jgi:hypothetical protein